MYVVSSDGTMNTVSSSRREVAVHERHLILVLEVAHGAQAADEQARAALAREVDEQAAERPHLDPRLVGERGADQLHALLDREQRLLGGVVRDGDDQPVDELQAAVHEILVPARDRVEAARHRWRFSSSARGEGSTAVRERQSRRARVRAQSRR